MKLKEIKILYNLKLKIRKPKQFDLLKKKYMILVGLPIKDIMY